VRKMTSYDGKIVIQVVEHIILKNFWEYYVVKDDQTPNESEDAGFALVMGFETELGYFSKSEISPYIRTRTKQLDGLMPAKGWKWVD